MHIDIANHKGRVEVTVLSLNGQVDGQNFQLVIDKAKELYDSGARDFLIDMRGLTYISSAGLVALHSIALLVRGEKLPDNGNGLSAYRSLGRSQETGKQQHVKLLSPLPEVRSVFEIVGFDRAFEIFTNLDEAVKSF